MPKPPSDKTTEPDLRGLLEEPGPAKDIPLYGQTLEDIVTPEHFLWQLQGAHPAFDDLIRLLYIRRKGFRPMTAELWPEDILIPGDFYAQGVVFPQIIDSSPGDGAPIPSVPKTAPEKEESPVEPLSHSVSPQAEAYGAESVRGYDGYEDYSGYSDRPEDYEDAPDPGKEESEGQPLPPEMILELLTDIQSQLAAANWEICKDVIAFDPEDFARIAARTENRGGFLPKALFRPFRSFCFWLSLAKIRFEIAGERCLGCFVYRGMNVSTGSPSPTFTLGFVTRNSFFDYTIPLTPHATLDYILESSADFLGVSDSEDGSLSEGDKKEAINEMKRVWNFLMPVIAHVYEHLPKHPRFRARKSLRAAVLSRRGMNSATIRHWRWDEKKGAFALSCPPALLQGELREKILQEFVRNEEAAPIEVVQAPGENPILN